MALDVLGIDIIIFDVRHLFRKPNVWDMIENVLENDYQLSRSIDIGKVLSLQKK